LHLEGEDLAELGFSNDPTLLATMELETVVRWPGTLFQKFVNLFQPDRSLTVAALIGAVLLRGGSPNTQP
jgi:hypothetical protein